LLPPPFTQPLVPNLCFLRPILGPQNNTFGPETAEERLD
jgi:hypothetical protein